MSKVLQMELYLSRHPETYGPRNETSLQSNEKKTLESTTCSTVVAEVKLLVVRHYSWFLFYGHLQNVYEEVDVV